MQFEIWIEKYTDQHEQCLLILILLVFQKKDQIRAHTKPDTEMGNLGKYIYMILEIENWDINLTTITFLQKYSFSKARSTIM